LYIYSKTLLGENKPKPYKNNYINNPEKTQITFTIQSKKIINYKNAIQIT